MARMRMRDIAQEAGVSPATVSRYLNGHYQAMSAETRERIAAVIERTDYRPSAAARSLRTDRSQMIGVVMADMRNPYSAAMVDELDAQAAGLGYSLAVAMSGNNPEREEAAIRRLIDGGVDGLVVNSCEADGTALAWLGSRTPAVLLDRDVAGSGLDLVTSNNDQLTGMLLDELAAGGCARAYLLTEGRTTSSVRTERARAFETGLAARGLAGEVVALTGDDGRDLARLGAMLRRDDDAAERDATAAGCGAAAAASDGTATSGGAARPAGAEPGVDADVPASAEPVGLVAVNGLVFLRLVECLQILGTRVPGEALVATFDDYAWNRVLFGGITTAVQDTATIAAKTLEWLLDAINAPQVMDAADSPAPRARRFEVEGHVIRRASTRPAPSGHPPHAALHGREPKM